MPAMNADAVIPVKFVLLNMILMKKQNKISLLIFSIYLLMPFTYSAKITKYKWQQIIIQIKIFIF